MLAILNAWNLVRISIIFRQCNNAINEWFFFIHFQVKINQLIQLISEMGTYMSQALTFLGKYINTLSKWLKKRLKKRTPSFLFGTKKCFIFCSRYRFIQCDELIKWLTTHNPIGHFKHPIFGDGINSASYSFNMQSIMEDLLTLCFHIACDVDWIIFGSHFFGKLKFKHTRMPYGDLQLLNDQTLWKNVVLSRK